MKVEIEIGHLNRRNRGSWSIVTAEWESTAVTSSAPVNNIRQFGWSGNDLPLRRQMIEDRMQKLRAKLNRTLKSSNELQEEIDGIPS